MNNKKMSETEKVVDTENSFLGIQHVLLAVKRAIESWVLVIICNLSFPNYPLKWSSDQNCEF